MSTNEGKLTRSILAEMTEDEWAVLQQLALDEGTTARNVIRRALKCLIEARGGTVPEGLFVDREKGNKFPKSDPPTKFSDRRAYNNTGMGVSAPAPVVSS